MHAISPPHRARPSILLVIGTFASVPYIHLQLESRRLFYPEVPLVVHDDCSPVSSQLHALCDDYGAEFVRSPRRLPPNGGDLTACVIGIQRAQARGIDLAVKFSRRFVPLENWAPSLQETARRVPCATYTHSDRGSHIVFRTECIGFHATTWMAYVQRLQDQISNPEGKLYFVEPFLHEIATNAQQGRELALDEAREGGYCDWHWMGDDRTRRNGSWLWHQADSPLDYARLAKAYGLPYNTVDFADPNMGFGEGHIR